MNIIIFIITSRIIQRIIMISNNDTISFFFVVSILSSSSTNNNGASLINLHVLVNFKNIITLGFLVRKFMKFGSLMYYTPYDIIKTSTCALVFFISWTILVVVFAFSFNIYVRSSYMLGGYNLQSYFLMTCAILRKDKFIIVLKWIPFLQKKKKKSFNNHTNFIPMLFKGNQRYTLILIVDWKIQMFHKLIHRGQISLVKIEVLSTPLKEPLVRVKGI